MREKAFALGLVVLLLLTAVGGFSSVSAQESCVTRTLPSGNQTAGSTITVSLDVVVGSATYYSIDEVVLTGWTVTSAGGGDNTSQSGHVLWLVIMGAADTTLTYTVTIPEDASGDYTFAGTYGMEGVSETAILGDTVVTVGAPTPQELTTITVSPVTAEVLTGGTQEFTATAKDQDGNPMAGVVLTWTSTNVTVGTVSPASATTDSNGNATTTFTALAEGTTTVVAYNASTGSSISGTATITVTEGFEYDPYDTNEDRKIDTGEMISAISDWKEGSYSTTELLTTLDRWKAGSY